MANNNPSVTLAEIAFGRIPLIWCIFLTKDKPLSRSAIEFIEYCRWLDFANI